MNGLADASTVCERTEGTPATSTTTMPATMKAVVMVRLGPAKEALLYRDHPVPERKPGDVLVAVRATSINPAEWRVRKGDMPKIMVKVPQILGTDVAGVVVAADPSSKFKAGDRVFGYTAQELVDPWGTYAEYVSTPEKRLMAIPDGVSFETAAVMPMAGLTAWQALAPSMPLAGKRVLVHGGSGGIGHLAVQIAKSQGAFVAATCSGRNTDFVTRELGADLAIDYTKKEPLESVAGAPYDVVVDLVGAEPHSWGVLKRNGRMAAVSFDNLINGRSNPWLVMLSIVFRMARCKLCSALGLCPAYDSIMQAPDLDKGLQQLSQLVSEGRVKVHVDKVVRLEDMVAAHEEAERSRTRGKVAVRVA